MSRHPAFASTRHRPWPLPGRPWVLQQEWLDLLFLHWEIDPSALRPLIPEELELDTFNGKAWLAVVPFRMRGVAPRACPKPAFLSDFPEINIRTYVIRDGRPGVWFLSLDVPHRLPVWIARTFFHLPYFRAEMTVRSGASAVSYRSSYDGRTFDADYAGLGPFSPESGSFEDWATERYCFYAQGPSGQLHRAEVQHPKWSLQRARCTLEENTMLKAFPIGPQHPSVLFCKALSVVAWWPERIS